MCGVQVELGYLAWGTEDLGVGHFFKESRQLSFSICPVTVLVEVTGKLIPAHIQETNNHNCPGQTGIRGSVGGVAPAVSMMTSHSFGRCDSFTAQKAGSVDLWLLPSVPTPHSLREPHSSGSPPVDNVAVMDVGE